MCGSLMKNDDVRKHHDDENWNRDELLHDLHCHESLWIGCSLLLFQKSCYVSILSFYGANIKDSC